MASDRKREPKQINCQACGAFVCDIHIPRAARQLARFMERHAYCWRGVTLNEDTLAFDCSCDKSWKLPASWRAKGGGRG